MSFFEPDRDIMVTSERHLRATEGALRDAVGPMQLVLLGSFGDGMVQYRLSTDGGNCLYYGPRFSMAYPPSPEDMAVSMLAAIAERGVRSLA